MFSKFSFDELNGKSKSFCDFSIENLEKLQIVIATLYSEHDSLEKIAVYQYFDENQNFLRFEIFCDDKKIETNIFIKALFKNYINLFEEKYNEIFKNMADLQREFKLLESNFQKLMKNKQTGSDFFSKTNYELMKEIDISNEKIQKYLNFDCKFKRVPLNKISKTMDFETIRNIIKKQILEIMGKT